MQHCNIATFIGYLRIAVALGVSLNNSAVGFRYGFNHIHKVTVIVVAIAGIVPLRRWLHRLVTFLPRQRVHRVHGHAVYPCTLRAAPIKAPVPPPQFAQHLVESIFRRPRCTQPVTTAHPPNQVPLSVYQLLKTLFVQFHVVFKNDCSSVLLRPIRRGKNSNHNMGRNF